MESENAAIEHARSVDENQRRLADNVKAEYDFIVCGAGSSGSVIAGRLAADPSINVLLLEAGGSDDVENVLRADLWPTNLGTERDWAFQAEPNPYLGGRRLPLSMGKVLGGGSSINVMGWARGHRTDWDGYAESTGDPAWNYDNVLELYRKIEDWQGAEDPRRRGSDGPVYCSPLTEPSPDKSLVLDAVSSTLGVPVFDSPNAEMMESTGGTALSDLLIRGDRRVSIYRSYTYPMMDRPNLTVLTGALVRRVIIENGAARGVEFRYRGALHSVRAQAEVVLSTGAILTPKVLMQSGVGDAVQLRHHGLPVLADLPGVGRNYQDHLAITSAWEWDKPVTIDLRPLGALYWPVDADANVPQLFGAIGFGLALGSAESLARFQPPANTLSIIAAVSHPQSRGSVVLTGAEPDDPVRIFANALSDPDDFRLTKAGLAQLRQIGNDALRDHVVREVMPTNLADGDLDAYIREDVITYWHQSGTAKMGTDADARSVVDGQLRVFGIDKLRVAGAPVLPRITAGNLMAPCVVIGERASQLLLEQR